MAALENKRFFDAFSKYTEGTWIKLENQRFF